MKSTAVNIIKEILTLQYFHKTAKIIENGAESVLRVDWQQIKMKFPGQDFVLYIKTDRQHQWRPIVHNCPISSNDIEIYIVLI